MNLWSGQFLIFNYLGNDLVTIIARYLEERRLEGQKEGEDNIPEVKRDVALPKAAAPNSNNQANTIRQISSYSPPKQMLQRSRYT